MNRVKLNNLINTDYIVIPIYMFKIIKKLKIGMDEFLFLMYLYNRKFTEFDPEIMRNELDMELDEVLGMIDSLTEKDLVKVDYKKNDGILEEVIVIDNFIDKLNLIAIDELNKEEKKPVDNSTIYSTFESEFGRNLSPMEIEEINSWLDDEIDEATIRKALKEATLNDVKNLRYISRILEDWRKNGKVETKNNIDLEDTLTQEFRLDGDWLNYDGEL